MIILASGPSGVGKSRLVFSCEGSPGLSPDASNYDSPGKGI